MDRRQFVRNSALGLCALPVMPAIGGIVPRRIQADIMPEWLKAMVGQADKAIESLLTYQEKDSKSPDLGGLRDGFDLLNPHSTAALIQYGASGLFSPASKFYR